MPIVAIDAVRSNDRYAVRRVSALAVTIVIAIAAACAPPAPVPSLAGFKEVSESLFQARIRDSSPAWRADHFFTPNLNGPFLRPRLPVGADTNDPLAYYKLGDSVEWREQGLADRAFYWASRLDPTMAAAYYARWNLRYNGITEWLYPDNSVRQRPSPVPNATAVDSLRIIAYGLNPFLDGVLNIPPQIRNLREFQADRDAATSGLWAYNAGNYTKAVKKWGEAIRKKPQNVLLHFPRAFAWVHLQQPDSAIADLTTLADRVEHIEDSTIGPYLSKDRFYYAIGYLRGGQQRYPEARAAYESALLENLGFYMAHFRLSGVYLFLHDTTRALTELETASLMRSDDPMLLAFRGSILLGQHRFDEADAQLRAAIHADTDFALPYAFRGNVAEQRHDTTNAIAGYREYLARASRSAPERGWVEARVAGLTR